MGRIRVLPDQIANKIAAGEVVERPASVVKELLENSLDAGGTRFRIEVESGGRRLIRITDDGCGMSRDDAMLAFERHATSKLRDVKDLLSIATLGFRGEALPSIASVSRLLLETRSAEESTGALVEIAGGKMLRCDEAALAAEHRSRCATCSSTCPRAKIPALRSDRAGPHRVAGHALQPGASRQDVSVDIGRRRAAACHAGRDSARARLSGIRQPDAGRAGRAGKLPAGAAPAAAPVAPPDAIAEYRREPDEPPSRVFRLTGFISRPQVQKGNRNSIFTFVNSRLIRDRLLLHAISSAYHNLMPHACYPFALLFLECDCEEVDVNVHPSKTEVRFRHQSFVHDFIRDTLRDRLIESRPAPAFSVAAAQPALGLPFSEFTQMLENEAPPPSEPGNARRGAGICPASRARPATEIRFRRCRTGDSPAIPRRQAARTRNARRFSAGISPPFSSSLTALGDLRPLGQIHESFIIAAGRDGLWIIDQHVAHERVSCSKRC